MNGKIVIPVSIIITIVIVVFSLTQIEKEISPQFEESSKIDSMLQQIREEKIKNDNSENPYVVEEREWIRSGPFQIDRSEYALGEKIFVNIDQINTDEKGIAIFLRPTNSTNYAPYHTMPFDGSGQRNNYYFTPDLSEFRKICSVDEIIGNWKVVFQGTEYSDLNFKVSAKIMPGYEDRYESVC